MTSYATAKAAVDAGVSPKIVLSAYRANVWVRILRAQHAALRQRDAAWIRDAVAAKDIGSFEQGAEIDLYLVLWHSLLYALIETWRGHKLSSCEIDRLLADPRVELLRNFRNAILHPRDYTDARIDAVTGSGDDAYDFYVSIADAFERYFEPFAAMDRAKRRQYPGAPGA